MLENTPKKSSHAANNKLFANIFSHVLQNIWRIINKIASVLRENIHVYFSLDLICFSKLTVFPELRSRKNVCILEQIMSADKYPCILLCQIEAFIYWSQFIQTRHVQSRLVSHLGRKMLYEKYRCWRYEITK